MLGPLQYQEAWLGAEEGFTARGWARRRRPWAWQRSAACHVSASSWLGKIVFKQTVVCIAMPVPVCPHSYFQSAPLTHSWMSHYSWLALTVPGNPKLYCPIHSLCSTDCMRHFCRGCIVFLLHLHLLFSVFFQKGPSSSSTMCMCFPVVQKPLCVAPYWLNADQALAICFITFYSSLPGRLKQLLHPGMCPHLWALKSGPAHNVMPTSVCSCSPVMR